ncbi:YiiX/YebB-like N1pC/P60 family cysteine hydrolase [Sphingopyxis sp.]|uniref:YiiX/YebB-like N1pC/P60 family cysteine hydrolase n=1 Tax=Sphingopyxis sp. TaxID=1908224 RepID=UPI003BABDF6A
MDAAKPLRRVKVEALQPGDIVLTATSGKISRLVRRASKGMVSHAMICVQHGSTIDSTDDGVQASNIQRELYDADDYVAVLRLRDPLSDIGLHRLIDFARSEVGTSYSKVEAARTVMGGPKPRTRKMFCSRLVARAYAAAGIPLVMDPDYCTPEELRTSSLLCEVADILQDVSEAELAAWDARPNPVAEMQRLHNEILDFARSIDPSIENFNDLDTFVQQHPEHDEKIARVYRESGYLALWKADFAINPWHYDIVEMDAITNDRTVAGLREYAIGTISEFHTGGLRFAVNLAHYEHSQLAGGRQTRFQLVQLYRRLVHNDRTRRDTALTWLRRRFPDDAKRYLERIVPHSELWFSIVDRVEPRLGMIARMNIEAKGDASGCSACGDPANDYLLVNSADAMPGVPSLRLCSDCVVIRRSGGEILTPIDD